MEEDSATKHLYLAVTTDKNEAELFNVKVLNDSPSYHRFEFSITSELTKLKQQVEPSETLQQKESMEWVYYLETNVNPLTGRGREPRMRINTNSQYTRLLLKKRINPSISSNTKQWRKGSEAYYISCIHWLRTGYLCVKESHCCRKGAKQDGDHYEVCIEPSINPRCDEHKVFMLFKLQPVMHFERKEPIRE